MTLIIFSAFLWGATLVLGGLAARRKDGTFGHGLRLALREASFFAPPLDFGNLCTALMAELLPAQTTPLFFSA